MPARLTKEEKKMTDKERLDAERRKAAEYLISNYSREERYLIIYARDFRAYLESAEWLVTAEARAYSKPYEFLADFESLRRKMEEFRWSKEFLRERGIDFPALRKLYFAVRG